MTLLIQTVNNIVTAINLSSGIVGTDNVSGGQYNRLAFPITIDSTKKHHAIVSYAVSISNPRNLELDCGTGDSDLSDVMIGARFNGSYAKIPFKSSVTITLTYPRKCIELSPKYISNITISNANATVNYGAVEKPIILSNIVNSFVNFKNDLDILFSTKIINNIFEQFEITSGLFKFREKNTQYEYSQIDIDGSKLIIPSNTLKNGKIYECYASCTVDDGQIADSEMIELNTIDTIPNVIISTPKNEITYGDVDFSWTYSNVTGMNQYAFDLEVSEDNLTWKLLNDHVITDSNKTKHKLEAGEWFWRVKGYNQNDIAGEWSQSSKFVNIAKPQIPRLSEILSSGMPIIKWSSESQIAFEIEVSEIWSSGQIYSSNKHYTFENYLPNGNYKMKLRVINEYNQFSDWLEFDYSQNMSVKQAKVIIDNTKSGFLIKIIQQENIEKHYILRNGVPIKKITYESEYEDIYVNGDIIYMIRSVDSENNFADVIVMKNRKCHECALIDLQGNIYDLNMNVDAYTKIDKTLIKESQDVGYIGRKKMDSIEGNLEYYHWNIAAFFDNLPVGEPLYYRDYSGASAWVKTHTINTAVNPIYVTASTTLTEIDFSEAIEYD